MSGYKIGFLTERMLLGFGVDLVIHKTAEGLVNKGYEVTVYTSATDGTYDNYGYNIKSIPIPASEFYPYYEYNAIRRADSLKEEGVDLFIVETFPFFSYPLLLKTPSIMVEHGVVPTTGFPLWKKSCFRYMQELQNRIYFKKADKIVTVSNFLKQKLPDKVGHKTDVIYNGVDHYPKVSRDKRSEFRERIGVDDDDILLLYVGRINSEHQPYKGTKQLIEMYEKLRKKDDKIKMLMVGFGDENDKRTLESHDIIPYIKAPVDMMPVIYSACDIYVTASQWEGFDLPLVEAQYFGKPTVAYEIGAHPEVVKDGETGFLVNSEFDFINSIHLLAEDGDLRKKMGRSAKKFSSRFTWDSAVEQYIKIIQGILGKKPKGLGVGCGNNKGRGIKFKIRELNSDTRTNADRVKITDTPLVSVIVLNYNAEKNLLQSCFSSLKDQTYPNFEVIMADNASTNDSVKYVKEKFPWVRIIKNEKNLGFAGGNNVGIKASKGKYVLLLNFDVEVDKRCISELVKVAEKDENIVGVATKMLFYNDRNLIDSVGNVITKNNEAFNLGIGQLDIGQYDRSERTLGACFGAALLKKEAFLENNVGLLDEDYFMYYEDVDWCNRANLMGYKIYTAPSAIVYHIHSGSAKQLPYSFKFHLIERNLIRTTIKNFEFKNMIRIVLWRMSLLLRNKEYRKPALQVIFETFRDLPRLFFKRFKIQRKRKVRDDDITKFRYGEVPFFDPPSYSPIYSLENLEFMYGRLFMLKQEQKAFNILSCIKAVKELRKHVDHNLLKKFLINTTKDEPEHVKEFIRKIEI